jgi:hypothetical protein
MKIEASLKKGNFSNITAQRSPGEPSKGKRLEEGRGAVALISPAPVRPRLSQQVVPTQQPQPAQPFLPYRPDTPNYPAYLAYPQHHIAHYPMQYMAQHPAQPAFNPQPRPHPRVPMHQHTQNPTLGRQALTRAERRQRQFTHLVEPLSTIFPRVETLLQLPPIKPTPNPLPRGYAPDSYCSFHRTAGHSTDNCYTLKNAVQDLIDNQVITVQDLVASSASYAD